MATAVSVRSDQFQVTKTLERVVLNFASLKDNSNKFYIMELQEGTGIAPYRIYTEYGRMGKNPRTEARFFQNSVQMKWEGDKLLNSKIKKGYRKVELDDSNSSVVTIKIKTNIDVSKISDKVLSFIGKIFKSSTNYITSSIQTPIGKLSAIQIEKGVNILQEIEENLDKKVINSNVYVKLSDDFYSVIPSVFNSRGNFKNLIIDDYEKLNDKKDLLGVMQSVFQVQDSIEKTLEDKYKSLGIKLKPLSKRTKEYKRLVNYVEESQSSHHRFNLDVQDILEVEDMKGFDQFNPYKVKTMELFHGSRNENYLSILQDGLKIKPKSAIHTGSMFGNGCYFANCSTKSANYTWGFSNKTKEDSYFLLVCDVAIGKPKEYFHAVPGLSSAPKGYNSVLGKKGQSLLHDEYIVYNENQAKIKYIIEFKERR